MYKRKFLEGGRRMSFRVEQEIKGTTYVYDVSSYWDKEKKQSRQKRVCVGKLDKLTGELIPSKKSKGANPLFCKDFGNTHFLKTISDDLGLTDILKKTFPEKWSEILTCAFFEVCERKPLYLCEQWSDMTENPSNKTLASQRISELLKSISDAERMDFFKSWGNLRAEHEYLAFDITSVSSYSEMIDMIEYGYNRDKEDLPQINIGMLFGQTSALPIFYNFYPGSIKDVSTLSNMIKFTEFLKIDKIKFVMDKGFYSKTNIDSMMEKYFKFTIAVPFSVDYAKSIVESTRGEMSTVSNTIMIGEDIIHSTTKLLSWNKRRLYAHVYYNERKYLDAKEALLKKILIYENALKNGDVKPSNDHKYSKYLSVRHSKNGIIIHRNEKEINATLLYKGYIVLISNDIKDAEEALVVYRTKDSVEKSFDNLKNDLDLNRLRVHSNQALKGRLFICFIALILQSWINKKMKDAGLYKKYTQEELLYELKKLKCLMFSSRKKVLNEVSKAQKRIFDLFEIPIPTLA